MNENKTVVGVFRDSWDTGHIAQDGAVIGFSEIELAANAEAQNIYSSLRIVELDIMTFVSSNLLKTIAPLDVIYTNCGPLASFLLYVRAKNNLRLKIIREVRTLGWIGYAFQEFVARELQQPDDLCIHTSNYSINTWQAFRGYCNDVLYYPMLRNTRIQRIKQIQPSSSLSCGFFSRLSRDKGFQYIPSIVIKLKNARWPILSLEICGKTEDLQLLLDCSERLRRHNIVVNYHGELNYPDATQLMKKVDVVLFPSISSYEASGRVIIEACNLGKTVISSDYCVGHDLLHPQYCIPLTENGSTTGDTYNPFPIAGLNIDAWSIPAWNETNFSIEDSEVYRYTPQGFSDIIRLEGIECSPQQRAPNVSMNIHWDEYSNLTATQWCDRVYSKLISCYRNRADLLDLGGLMKRSILNAGFKPSVTFWKNESTCSNI
jgi:hypothetical protein